MLDCLTHSFIHSSIKYLLGYFSMPGIKLNLNIWKDINYSLHCLICGQRNSC